MKLIMMISFLLSVFNLFAFSTTWDDGIEAVKLVKCISESVQEIGDPLVFPFQTFRPGEIPMRTIRQYWGYDKSNMIRFNLTMDRQNKRASYQYWYSTNGKGPSMNITYEAAENIMRKILTASNFCPTVMKIGDRGDLVYDMERECEKHEREDW